MEKEKIKILYMSDFWSITTGFGKVGREVLPRLAKLGYRIEHLAWCYQRQVENNFSEVSPDKFKVYAAESIEYPTLKFGRSTLAGILQETKPDILFTQGDVFMIDYIPQIIDKMGRDTPIWLSLFPIDGVPVPYSWISTIERMDICAIYTEFGRQEVIKTTKGKLNPLAIHLGVDSEVYKPMDKGEAKKMLGLEGKFIVGSIGRNQIKKNIDAIIKAFAIFCKDKPEAMLYLHCAPKKYKRKEQRTKLKSDVGWDLLDLTARYHLEDKIVYPENVGPDSGVTEKALNVIINSWDMAIYTSQGEGANLPLYESMACGIPCIATDYSAHREVLQGRGELVSCYFHTSIHDNIERAYPIMSDLLTKMNLLYHDKDLRSKHSRASIKFAKTLTWDATATKLDNAIQKYYEDRKRIHWELIR